MCNPLGIFKLGFTVLQISLAALDVVVELLELLGGVIESLG